MDISKVTVRELLENKAACDAMNAIDPKILKEPHGEARQGQDHRGRLQHGPRQQGLAEVKAKIREALAAI